MPELLASSSAGTELERLASTDWGFAGDTTRDLTHNLHPWPAKYIPPIPRAVIQACAQAGARVLDPFVGCGTTALEALRSGCIPVVSDVNPLAVLITRAKCEPPLADERQTILAWAAELPRAAVSDAAVSFVPVIPNVEYWFDEDVIAQLSVLRRAIAELGVARLFLDVVFSSIILSVSHQESETRYRRVVRDVTGSDVLRRFQARLMQALSMAAEFEEVVPEDLPATIECCDARDGMTDSGLCDVAVFSPPYPNSFDYHLYHRFRMFWLGFDPRTVKHQEIGAHLRYLDADTWRRDMRASLQQTSVRLRDGAYCVVIVGDGVIVGEVVPSAQILTEEAIDLGFSLELDLIRPVASSRKSFNQSDARLRAEHVVVLRR